MKKIFIILTVGLLIMGCAYASNSHVNINGIDFELPEKYQGGEEKNRGYELDNVFSIRCIDDNPINAIGLWAAEKDFSEDSNIAGHPVRHYFQYNQYVNGNHSHAYFASGESVYEISWTGSQIDRDIEKLIKNTPKSKIDDDAFYGALDKSVDIYKEVKKDQLNKDSEYNYLEAKYNSQVNQQKPDDTRLKEILLTYYNR